MDYWAGLGLHYGQPVVGTESDEEACTWLGLVNVTVPGSWGKTGRGRGVAASQTDRGGQSSKVYAVPISNH